jgi:hypothetical protein
VRISRECVGKLSMPGDASSLQRNCDLMQKFLHRFFEKVARVFRNYANFQALIGRSGGARTAVDGHSTCASKPETFIAGQYGREADKFVYASATSVIVPRTRRVGNESNHNHRICGVRGLCWAGGLESRGERDDGRFSYQPNPNADAETDALTITKSQRNRDSLSGTRAR